jgi:hypothetical protein
MDQWTNGLVDHWTRELMEKCASGPAAQPLGQWPTHGGQRPTLWFSGPQVSRKAFTGSRTAARRAGTKLASAAVRIRMAVAPA